MNNAIFITEVFLLLISFMLVGVAFALAQGMIVMKNSEVLPCRVGDTLYMPWEVDGIRGIETVHVVEILIDKNGGTIDTDLEIYDLELYQKYKGGMFNFSDIGKLIFYTKTEAEGKL